MSFDYGFTEGEIVRVDGSIEGQYRGFGGPSTRMDYDCDYKFIETDGDRALVETLPGNPNPHGWIIKFEALVKLPK